jgi:hypothetical protein
MVGTFCHTSWVLGGAKQHTSKCQIHQYLHISIIIASDLLLGAPAIICQTVSSYTTIASYLHTTSISLIGRVTTASPHILYRYNNRYTPYHIGYCRDRLNIITALKFESWLDNKNQEGSYYGTGRLKLCSY